MNVPSSQRIHGGMNPFSGGMTFMEKLSKKPSPGLDLQFSPSPRLAKVAQDKRMASSPRPKKHMLATCVKKGRRTRPFGATSDTPDASRNHPCRHTVTLPRITSGKRPVGSPSSPKKSLLDGIFRLYLLLQGEGVWGPSLLSSITRRRRQNDGHRQLGTRPGQPGQARSDRR